MEDKKHSIERLQVDRDRIFALYRDSEDRVGVLEKQCNDDQVTIVGLQKQVDRWTQKHQESKAQAKKDKAALTQQLHKAQQQQRHRPPQVLGNSNEDEEDDEDGQGVWREVQEHELLMRQNNLEVTR